MTVDVAAHVVDLSALSCTLSSLAHIIDCCSKQFSPAVQSRPDTFYKQQWEQVAGRIDRVV